MSASEPGDAELEDEIGGEDAVIIDFDPGSFEFDESMIDGPTNIGAAPSARRRGAVATAFLGMGLALEEVVYGRERSVPAVVQEASDPDPDRDLELHLDTEEPRNTWVRMRDR
jgi:hypothetical protein